MDVILDTNIYTALLLSQGRNIFSSNAFVELFTYLRRTKSDLILPGPVFQEIVKEYSDLISGSIKKAQDSWTTLQRNTISTLTECFPPKRDAEIKGFHKELAAKFIAWHGETHPSPSHRCDTLCEWLVRRKDVRLALVEPSGSKNGSTLPNHLSTICRADFRFNFGAIQGLIAPCVSA